MKSIYDLIIDLDIIETKGNLDTMLSCLSYDSRKVVPGCGFVCVEGFKSDGHKYVPSALEQGATAVIAQKPVEVPEGVPLVIVRDTRKALALMSTAMNDYPSRKLTMVGVTGTNGKTTTTYLVERIFEEEGYKVGLIGTIINKIDKKVFPVTNTTPESLDLQLLLKEMVDTGVTHVVMEVSSHALELGRTEGVEFDNAVFTNVSQDHLDFHGNMENYLKAKAKLFAALDSNIRKKIPKYAIINADDPSAKTIIEATKGRILTYGVKNDCDIKAFNINLRADRAAFDVATPKGDLYLEINLPGMFNIYNSLAALAVGVSRDIGLGSIKTALESVKGVPGRMEKVSEGQEFSVLVDYAHTPDGLENIIRAAREFARGRVITVFGCGGDRDRTKRPVMGEISARLSDYSILTSDNPRTEDPFFIISQIEEGVRKAVDRSKYSVIPDRREAIGSAVKMAEAGDVILIAGKGHETYQIVNDKVNHFDDREVAREMLKKYN
ncbi:UDP-N-acetylmuramoyl-L-alanyl-D-glutamate--2,6-diaminopimelate ligase [Phosphitispora sp. TUW77]|uniref:UDP-N-acetylmuramoyl-L-alanyl-D-glutamate--2, 6-diaminopimelate ligase n=1 Tax=Phosphitispora sp. TUW77 TaxID=3152361 RepID=UPI003AB2D63C